AGQNGRIHPPMHASTWHAMSACAQAAATSGTGSIAANGYEGADTTTSATSGPSRAATAAASTAPVSGETGTASKARPNSSAALRKAAWTVTGATSRGTAV